MIDKLKFKHLEQLISPTPDYTSVMTEVLGFNNNWLGRKWVFIRKFKECHNLMQSAKRINPKQISYSEDCPIKKPDHIDDISFIAMMELQTIMSSTHDNVVELMTRVIATVCYEANYDTKYDSNSLEYKSFVWRVRNSSMIYMLGLYNWIDKAIEDSKQFWEQKFFEVEVEDQDYIQAGGRKMNQFNVIITIKTLCQEFNISYDEAWHMSYALVQTSSLAKATQNYIQEQMRIIKEARMRREREREAH